MSSGPEDSTKTGPMSAVRAVLTARLNRLGKKKEPPELEPPQDSQVKVSPKVDVASPPSPPTETVFTKPRSDVPIGPSPPPIPPIELKGSGGKKMKMVVGPKGKVTLTAPPPPIRSVTFSGGGGKGAALPGAIQALEKEGVLSELKEVSGASVGSMTAALVACGSTADEFTDIANDPSVVAKIKEHKNMAEVIFGGGLSGEGLEELVRAKSSGCLRKRLAEYIEEKTKADEDVEPQILEINKVIADGNKGPTFGQLRVVSKIIPAVKEITISGTYVAQLDPKTKEPIEENNPQLVVFSADTEPDLEIAQAVRASAALPPVFNPVDIKLSSGIWARFQDGGVLNNVPNDDTLQVDRDLEPMPDSGSMTFIFESDEAKEMLQGKATPSRSRINDFFSKAENSAAKYGTNRILADKPEELVMVPLIFEVTKGKKTKKKDFSGLLSGTVNFGMAMEDKLKLQELTEEATTAHVGQRRLDKSHEFDSVEQMLMCLPLNDLQAIVGEVDGAQEAYEFRNQVSADVDEIVRLVKELGFKEAANNKTVLERFEEFDKLSTNNFDRQGFVARAINRHPELDGLLKAMRSKPGPKIPALEACLVVNDGIIAQAHVRNILREILYPKLVRQDEGSAGQEVLLIVESILRAATSPAKVNEGLEIAIKHFGNKTDIFGLSGHKEFAEKLEKRMMKTT